jgi:hypothetical protein
MSPQNAGAEQHGEYPEPVMESTSVRGGIAGLRMRFSGWRATIARIDPVVLGLVLAIGVVAFGAHAAYRENLRLRWSSAYHDRNAHYQAGLNIASELRQGHFLRALLDLDASSLGWPVLHPFCLAAVLTVAGPSPLAAVLPSLFGWCASALLAFLIARRLGGEYGAAGGLIAAALFLASPALRALATDVMLESLGLCLTLASLYAYLRFAERPTRRTGIALGVALSCLFLQKYNYWGITVIALVATELLRRPREVLAGLQSAVRMVDWSAWLGGQFRRPLNYVILALLGVSAAAVLNGGLYVEVNGQRYGFRETRLIVNAAYVLVLLRMAAWWWPAGRDAVARVCGEPFVALWTWAATPVMVWLALPFRLHYFLWYAGPGNNIAVLNYTPRQAFGFYRDCFVGDYHAVVVVAGIAVVLAAVGLAAIVLRRDVPAGWVAVPGMFFICGTLTVIHPNQQLRFLHSWAPLVWVMAGIGVATVLHLAARLAGQTAARIAAVATVIGVAVSLAAVTPALAQPGAMFGRGYGTPAESLRDLYDVYLPHLDGNEPTALFCNLPEASWRWAFMEHFGHKNGLKHNMREVGAFDPVTADVATRWLGATSCRQVVYVDIPPRSPLYEPPIQGADNSAILAVMKAQGVFTLVKRVRVRNLGTVDAQGFRPVLRKTAPPGRKPRTHRASALCYERRPLRGEDNRGFRPGGAVFCSTGRKRTGLPPCATHGGPSGAKTSELSSPRRGRLL